MWMDGMACARTGGCTPQSCTNTLPEQTQDYGWAVECSAWIWTLSESKVQINLLAPHQDCAHAPSITRAGQGLVGRRGPALGPAGSFVLLSSLASRVRILGVFIYCQAESPCDCGNTCRPIKLFREEFWKVLLIQELNLGWACAPQLSVLLLDGILITADLPTPPAFFFPLSPSPNNLILAQFPYPLTLLS